MNVHGLKRIVRDWRGDVGATLLLVDFRNSKVCTPATNM